jgi:hypothetical protein
MCSQRIRGVLDIPNVSVDRVVCIEVRQKQPKGDPPLRPPGETLTPLERRLAEMLFSDRDEEREEMRSVGRQIAAGDAVRGYMADLCSLSGRTVASSALLPAWQPREVWNAPPIPGSPFHQRAPEPRPSSWWVVDLDTRWQAVGLGARVDINLVKQDRTLGRHAATLARVWLRAQLNPCGQEPGTVISDLDARERGAR